MLSIIPIMAIPNYKFSSKIFVDKSNKTLSFEINYNELARYWVITIGDSTGKIIIASQPIIPAQNILEQYSYLEIGSAYIIPAQTLKEQWPSRETLGTDWCLIWGDTKGDDWVART